MKSADFLIIGGGVAGLSAAARLVKHGSVTVLEGEEALGYHSSGRSVTFSHFGIGNSAVRALTAHSRPFYEAPPEGFETAPLSQPQPSAYLATEETLARLEALHAQMSQFTDRLQWMDEERMKEVCPVLRTGEGGFVRGVLDDSGLKLDAEALLQSLSRAVRGGGGELLMGQRIEAIELKGDKWHVRNTADEEWSAPILINAA
ncbi:MAG TPA: FAD-dependent oxidoreductase, partial [Allosphingosinicella sp.]|nr:FAD-dependent oxidoreductase [Allosphingosinicella sp.]